MLRILILYYSHTGNTEEMAKAIAEGAKTIQEVEVELKRHISPWRLKDFDAVLIGDPTYHHKISDKIKRLLQQFAFHEVNLKGKIGAAFGSYGWSGEAPRLILEILENKFEMEVLRPPLLIKYSANEEGLENCRNLGKRVAQKTLKAP